MQFDEVVTTIQITLAAATVITFAAGIYYLFQPMDEPRGIGLMLAALVLQNYKKNFDKRVG